MPWGDGRGSAVAVEELSAEGPEDLLRVEAEGKVAALDHAIGLDLLPARGQVAPNGPVRLPEGFVQLLVEGAQLVEALAPARVVGRLGGHPGPFLGQERGQCLRLLRGEEMLGVVDQFAAV